ncbi:MAG: SRPBCC family protein [Actinomycetota bacterium]|nr:SRPBCC family protein [Actinomycetota bacterium]
MNARASILIKREPAEVFALVADPANDRLWRSHLTSSRGQVTGVGDRVMQVYSAQGKTKTVELEVTDSRPPERHSSRMQGPVRARLSLQCRPEDGGTRVSMSLSADVSGVATLVEDRVEAEVVKLARTDLERLRRVMESVG